MSALRQAHSVDNGARTQAHLKPKDDDATVQMFII